MIKKLEFNGEQQYLDMLQTILSDGTFEGDERTDTGTFDLFGYQMRFDLSEGEIPLLTTKKMFTKGIITELAWFCQGRTDIKWLMERGSNFWNADAHRVYLKDWKNHPIKFIKNLAGTDELVSWERGDLNDTNKELHDFYLKVGVEAFEKNAPWYRPFTMSEFKHKILNDEEFNEAFGDLGKVYGYQWTNWEKAAGSEYAGFIPEIPLIRKVNKDDIINGINCTYYIVETTMDGEYCLVQFLDNNASIKYGTLDDVPYHLAIRGHIQNPYRQRESIDQLQSCIDQLRNAPASRRIIVSAWNPSDIDTMALPPCHLLFQFSSHKLTLEERKKIWGFNRDQEVIDDLGDNASHGYFDSHNIPQRDLSCQLYQRSSDSFLGVPFNIASYSILVHIIANMLNYQPKEFVWTSGSTHIYNNHVEQAKEQITRKPLGFPTIEFNRKITDLKDFTEEDIEIVGYKHHDKIKADLNVG